MAEHRPNTEPAAEPDFPFTHPADRAARIRLLNDTLRQGYPTGEVLLTRSVHALPKATRWTLILLVQVFDAFNDANDPYGEHDFGTIDLDDDEVYIWKIDYYDLDRIHASPDPADPDVTRRVLTIMRWDEY